jgi:hypothetical protein
MAATPAVAWTLVDLSAEQITDHTEVWIHGRVIAFSCPVIKVDKEMGMVLYDATLDLKVIDATDDAVTGIVTIRSETMFGKRLKQGETVFAAFKKEGDALVPHFGLGGYGWVGVNTDTNTVSSASGVVDAAVYWRWLSGIRYAADTIGKATAEDIDYWQQAAGYGEPAHKNLGIRFFKTLAKQSDNAPMLLETFFWAYNDAVDRKPGAASSYSDLRKRLLMALEFIRDDEVNEVGAVLIQFIEYDATALKMLDDRSLRNALLALLQNVTDPVILAALPRVYESHTWPLPLVIARFPLAPSEDMDAWLWAIVSNPRGRGLQTKGDLIAALRTLANRNADGLIPYLTAVAAGEEELPVNGLGGAESPAQMMSSVLELLASLERKAPVEKGAPVDDKVLAREERLTVLARQIEVGVESALYSLSQEIRPKDRWLIPELKTLTSAQWHMRNHYSRLSPAATIMRTLADPVFLPVLEELARDSFDLSLLKALVACGGQDTAMKHAIKEMSTEIPDCTHSLMTRALDDRAEIVLFLGEQGDPELVNHFQAYTERDAIQAFEDAYVTFADHGRSTVPYAAWRLQGAALFALAKSKGHAAAPQLERAYENGEIQARFAAALALYVVGSETGVDLIHAYRDRQERAITGEDEGWFDRQGGLYLAATAIHYFEHPKLDQLYFARTTRGFARSDTPVMNTAFFERNRAALLRMLRSRINSPDPTERASVVRVLRARTGENFGFDDSALRVHQQAAIAKWKDYIATQ